MPNPNARIVASDRKLGPYAGRRGTRRAVIAAVGAAMFAYGLVLAMVQCANGSTYRPAQGRYIGGSYLDAGLRSLWQRIGLWHVVVSPVRVHHGAPSGILAWSMPHYAKCLHCGVIALLTTLPALVLAAMVYRATLRIGLRRAFGADARGPDQCAEDPSALRESWARVTSGMWKLAAACAAGCLRWSGAAVLNALLMWGTCWGASALRQRSPIEYLVSNIPPNSGRLATRLTYAGEDVVYGAYIWKPALLVVLVLGQRRFTAAICAIPLSCPRCRYDLRGAASERCSECGAIVPAELWSVIRAWQAATVNGDPGQPPIS